MKRQIPALSRAWLAGNDKALWQGFARASDDFGAFCRPEDHHVRGKSSASTQPPRTQTPANAIPEHDWSRSNRDPDKGDPLNDVLGFAQNHRFEQSRSRLIESAPGRSRERKAVRIRPFAGKQASCMLHLVRKERLELSRVAPLEPKSSASTNSATFATLGTRRLPRHICRDRTFGQSRCSRLVSVWWVVKDSNLRPID